MMNSHLSTPLDSKTTHVSFCKYLRLCSNIVIATGLMPIIIIYSALGKQQILAK
jgi:hypothetical protein